MTLKKSPPGGETLVCGRTDHWKLLLGQQFYHTGSGHIEEIWQTGF